MSSLPRTLDNTNTMDDAEALAYDHAITELRDTEYPMLKGKLQ